MEMYRYILYGNTCHINFIAILLLMEIHKLSFIAPCTYALGMESGRIRNGQTMGNQVLDSSGPYHAASCARLNFLGQGLRGGGFTGRTDPWWQVGCLVYCVCMLIPLILITVCMFN